MNAFLSPPTEKAKLEVPLKHAVATFEGVKIPCSQA